jgi:uroporphyrin-3 C-methyltransferase
VLALGLVLAAGAGFLYYRLDADARLREQAAAATVDALRAQVAEMDKRLVIAHGAQESAAAKLEEMRGESSRLREEFVELKTRMAVEQSRDEGIWALREALYLLTVAQQRLALDQDVTTAAAAVAAADSRLAESGDAGLIPVREQLTTDLSALNAIAVPDLSGMALQLADLAGRVEDLPLRAQFMDEARAREAAVPPADNGWRALAATVWSDLSRLVDVRATDVPDEIIFDPARRQALQLGLRQELTVAKLMVVRRDAANLRASLDAVEAALKRYHDIQAPAVADALAVIARLRTADLAPPLPDLERAAQLLRAAIERRAAPVER